MSNGDPARVIGVLGAGTMGAGIAQLACRSGAQTLLYDPLAEALQRGATQIQAGLAKDAARGRLGDGVDAEQATALLATVSDFSELAPCELVIEAAPERLELKHELYARLSETVSERCVLATNTSSLLVTAIAAAASNPERVVGMHFFNPAPVMALLEVIAGVQSSERALELARATGTAMGKQVIDAADGPGFIVNRCNRPFGLEALRLLSERVADIETIDRICRMAGGFRMGPFELMDLVGIDTGLEISRSFYEQSFYEPRWRPSPISARYVAAGLFGRKSGRGYYDYSGAQPHRPEDTPPPSGPPALSIVPAPSDDPTATEQPAASQRPASIEQPAGSQQPVAAEQPSAESSPAKPRGDGVVMISGNGLLARELRAAAQAAGYRVCTPGEAYGELPSLILECGLGGPSSPQQLTPRIVLCAAGSLAALDHSGTAVGFHALPPFADASLVELTRSERSAPTAVARAERFFATLGKHTAWVADAPGLVLGRIVCQVINESAFALGEGVGSAADIDTGMTLGLNYPRGPFAWAQAIGADHVLAVLDALNDEYREERYRAAPTLRRLARTARS
jgi:3-hydroxybutyryl-CoA dehydrogenase